MTTPPPDINGKISRTSSDLDAYRRFRTEQVDDQASAIVGALDQLAASEEPMVTFSRLVAICASSYADGCDVALQAGSERAAEVRAEHGKRRLARADGSDVVRAPFVGIGQGDFPSYAGVLSCWWRKRRPTNADVLAVNLLARHAVALVRHEQVAVLHGRYAQHSADLAMEAITNRPINIAIGVLMGRRGVDDRDAEDVLRSRARELGSTLYMAARELLDSPHPKTRPDPSVARLPRRRP